MKRDVKFAVGAESKGRHLTPSLAGKVVLITGAAGTIGRAAAEACLAIGAKVVLSDVRAAEAFSMANILKPLFGSRVGAVALNLRDVRSIRSAVRKVLDNFGRTDSLVCNAATLVTGKKN